ncbi:MYND-type domain-containing protein [Mycena chlorophos]|uniref:MYND-type domain-containing protein n=1 Tax=Mycena chlorophos TaxID=658473 RepID=A0A8H6S750_MYCCL|nr:MYND-type domain-containing protein [Mycena chlorophos]
MMHPSLSLSNVQRLPSPLKELAREALDPSRDSALSLQVLAAEISPRLPSHIFPLLQPVFFHHLALSPLENQARIASDDDLLAVLQCKASAALESLLGFLALRARGCHFPHRAKIDIWARAWPWIQFMDEFWPVLGPTWQPRRMYGSIIAFLVSVFNELDFPGYAEAVAAPGPNPLRRVLFHALPIITRAERDGDLWPEIVKIPFGVLLGMEETRAQELQGSLPPTEQLIELSGGVEDLARAIVSYLAHLFPHPSTAADNSRIFQLRPLWYNLLSPHLFKHPSLREAAFNHGFAAVFVTVLRCITAPNSRLVQDVAQIRQFIADEFPNVARLFMMELTPKLLLPALDAGLFAIIFGSIDFPLGPENLQLTRGRFFWAIKQNLPYLSCLPNILSAINKVPTDAPPRYLDGPTLDSWNDFVVTTREYASLAEQFNAGVLPRFRACDNSPCGRVLHYKLLKRCSGCKERFYCSVACQKNAWKRQSHDFKCSYLYAEHLELRQVMGGADFAFLQALMRHELIAELDSIMQELLWYHYTCPGGLPALFFDFTLGKCTIEIDHLSKLQFPQLARTPSPDSDPNADSSSDSDSDFEPSAAQWGEVNLNWMLESGNRILYHEATFRFGEMKISHAAPFRMSTSRFLEGVKELADRLRVDGGEIVLEDHAVVLRELWREGGDWSY